MPVDFDKCVSSGGKVRTKVLKDGKYIHICFKDGQSFAGEVKERKPKEGKELMKTLEHTYSKGAS